MVAAYDLAQLFRSLAGRRESQAPLAPHSSFGIGGPADLLLFPPNVAALRQAAALAREHGVALVVLGAGTNVLVSDAGVRGVVLSLKEGFQGLGIESGNGGGGRAAEGGAEVVVRAEAGVKQARLARFAQQHGLAGAEFMIGIPGTVGGAVRMNAGTRAACTADILLDAEVLLPDGRLATLGREEIGLSYRASALPADAIVVAARLRLVRDDPAGIAARMAADSARRKATQPLACRSAGSFFKNPPGTSAGWLIDAAGLKEAAVGDARVSRRHANFLINVGQARAHDVVALMRHVQRSVAHRWDVWLTPEVTMVGDEHAAHEPEEEAG